LKLLGTICDALESKENLKKMREKDERECESMTMRVLVQSNFQSRQSVTNPAVLTQIYKIMLPDINKKGFLLLKHPKSKTKNVLDSVRVHEQYLLDRAKVELNVKGELIVSSTTLTVLREESEESVASLELS